MIRLSCPSLGISFEVPRIDLSVRYGEWKLYAYTTREDGITECQFTNGFKTERFVTGDNHYVS